jgi:hypothetical protein
LRARWSRFWGKSLLTLTEFTERLAAAKCAAQRRVATAAVPEEASEMEDGCAGEREARGAGADQFADYSKSPGVYSLPGAAFDAKRIPEALRAAGFETTLVFNANAETARKAMADFGAISESADASVVYIGGHGMQHKRMVYWLMGDYPEQDEKWLPTHAIAIDEIGRVGRARDVNLVLYASCRDDPFR